MFLDARLPDRFWRKVQPEPNSGCWLWLAAEANGGYGAIVYGGRMQRAHRVAYEALVGEIAEGLQVDHLCRTRSCVNPAHLEPVTQRVNLLRGSGIASRCASATHCPSGHPYDEKNTRIVPTKSGTGRVCIECNKINCAKWYRIYRDRKRAA